MAKRKSTKVLSWKQQRCFVLQGRIKSISENISNMRRRTNLLTDIEDTKLATCIITLNSILYNFDSSTATLEDEVKP